MKTASKLEGVDKLLKTLKKAPVQIQKAITGTLITSGVQMRNGIRRKIVKTKTGKVYYVGKQHGNIRTAYRASAPGQAPGSPTGRYPYAIGVKFHLESGEPVVTIGVHSSSARLQVIASALELGSSHNKARPHIQRELQLRAARIGKALAKNTSKAIQKAGFPVS